MLASEYRRINPTKARVVLVEADSRVLPTYPVKLSELAEKSLKHMGIEVQTNNAVEGIDERGVTTRKGRIAGRTVLWASGIKASPVACWLGIPGDKNGRVKVDSFLRPLDEAGKSIENVYVVGDCAHFEQDGEVLPCVSPVAVQQGRFVGRRLAHTDHKIVDPSAFHYHDKGSMATIGRKKAVGVIGPVKIGGFVAWFLWLGVHIWYLIGFHNKVLVMQWAWAYMRWDRSARLITGHKPSVH